MGSWLNRSKGFKPRSEPMERSPMPERPWWEAPPAETRSRLIWELDREHSLKVRRRDGRCVICGRTRDLEASHYYSRRHFHTRWDDRNVNAMCGDCNLRHNEDYWPYALFMLETYGNAVLAELRALKGLKQKFEVWDMEARLKELRAA